MFSVEGYGSGIRVKGLESSVYDLGVRVRV